MQVAPGWQTDELAEEWIEEEEEVEEPIELVNEVDDTSASPNDVPQGTCNFGTTDFGDGRIEEQEETTTAGTFVVRAELPPPVLPQTPGVKKIGMKNMFSPLQLEKMFEPPSPPKAPLQPISQNVSVSPPVPFKRRIASKPVNPSKLSQVIQAPSVVEEVDGAESSSPETCTQAEEQKQPLFGEKGPKSSCEFTFNCKVPDPQTNEMGADGRATLPSRHHDDYVLPILKELPNPNDPRLRLFQLQYDTYTRDHLSAIVDSFVISSPSNNSNSQTSASTMLASSPDSKAVTDDLKVSQRASKRLKLTPPTELPATFSPPRVHSIRPLRRDYVGESRSLMQRIKQARDFSLLSIGNVTEIEQTPPTTQSKRFIRTNQIVC